MFGLNAWRSNYDKTEKKGMLINFNTYMTMIFIDPKRCHDSIAGEIKFDGKIKRKFTKEDGFLPR